MPYRRLPNTDLSRIAALKRAIEMEGVKHNGQLVLSYRTIQDASSVLNKFQRAQKTYQQNYDLQLKESKSFRTETQTARLYISHFIQVMNMAIQRGEIKKEIRPGYGLEIGSSTIPELSNEQNILEWGDKIIRGEEARTAKGGVPIFNPTIAKVKVHYNIFAEHLFRQRIIRENTNKALDEVTKLRPETDDIILDIWNQVELFYDDLPLEEKIEKCKTFGLVYYFRSSELAKMKADKMQKNFSF